MTTSTIEMGAKIAAKPPILVSKIERAIWREVHVLTILGSRRQRTLCWPWDRPEPPASACCSVYPFLLFLCWWWWLVQTTPRWRCCKGACPVIRWGTTYTMRWQDRALAVGVFLYGQHRYLIPYLLVTVKNNFFGYGWISLNSTIALEY